MNSFIKPGWKYFRTEGDGGRRLLLRAGFLFVFGLMFSCERFEPASELVFRTEGVEELEQGGFRVTGRIINVGDGDIREHGFCWSESANPTTGDPVTRLGRRSGEGTFTSTIEDFSMDRLYYVRAYITKDAGTYYGGVLTFQTPPPEVPVVLTHPVSGIGENSVRIGGEVISDGGAEVTESGVCWSTFPGPAISDNRVLSTTRTGAFTVTIEGLFCSTTYYVRAYATNVSGTAYGDEVSFTTATCIPQVGAFIFADRDGIFRMDQDGMRGLFVGSAGAATETFENRIYTYHTRTVYEYGDEGNLIRSIPVDSRIIYPYEFCALPGDRFAFLDNENDFISIINSSGSLIREIPVAESLPESSLQNIKGVVVENQLVVSAFGNNQLLRVNLDTYQWSVFRDFSHLAGGVSDIDFADGVYYLCHQKHLYAFTEKEEERLICELPDYNNTGVAVLGDFAYVTSNFGNKVYRINIRSGDFDAIVGDANYPQDIELIK